MDIATVKGKAVYFNDNGCNVENWLKQGLLYGEPNYKVLQSLVIEEGWMVDAGAHIGTFSFSPAFANIPIITIEGCHNNVLCLHETFKETSAEVHEAILADRVKRCRFSRDTGPFGWLIDDPDGDCTTNTIDNIVSGRHVNALKLDIEGGEIDALDGAKETLTASKPPILMEVNGYCLMQHDHRSEDLLKKVSEFGYVIFAQLHDQIFRVDPNKLFPFCNIDVICIHEDNLNKYSFANSRSLEQFELEDIAYQVCKQSNDDCKSYFKKIGIE